MPNEDLLLIGGLVIKFLEMLCDRRTEGLGMITTLAETVVGIGEWVELLYIQLHLKSKMLVRIELAKPPMQEL